MLFYYNNHPYEADPDQTVIILDHDGQKTAMLYMPGLPCPVQINISGHHPVWDWNGDVKRPTFSPSILTRLPWGQMHEEIVNHVFVRDGKIHYLGDCTHAYKNKIIDLPMLRDWPEEMRLW